MIATSVSSARRATVRGGTIGLAVRGAVGTAGSAGAIWPTRAVAGILAAAGRRRTAAHARGARAGWRAAGREDLTPGQS